MIIVNFKQKQDRQRGEKRDVGRDYLSTYRIQTYQVTVLPATRPVGNSGGKQRPQFSSRKQRLRLSSEKIKDYNFLAFSSEGPTRYSTPEEVSTNPTTFPSPFISRFGRISQDILLLKELIYTKELSVSFRTIETSCKGSIRRSVLKTYPNKDLSVSSFNYPFA